MAFADCYKVQVGFQLCSLEKRKQKQISSTTNLGKKTTFWKSPVQVELGLVLLLQIVYFWRSVIADVHTFDMQICPQFAAVSVCKNDQKSLISPCFGGHDASM